MRKNGLQILIFNIFGLQIQIDENALSVWEFCVCLLSVPPNLQFGGYEYKHLKCEKNGLQIHLFNYIWITNPNRRRRTNWRRLKKI